jgi:uncharacterized protein
MEFKRFWHQSGKPTSLGERSIAERLHRHRTPQDPPPRHAEDDHEARPEGPSGETQRPPRPAWPSASKSDAAAKSPPAMSADAWNSALEGDPWNIRPQPDADTAGEMAASEIRHDAPVERSAGFGRAATPDSGGTPKTAPRPWALDELRSEAGEEAEWAPRPPEAATPQAAATAEPEPPEDGTPSEIEALADEFDDIGVNIGRVVSIRGSVVWGALYDDADGTTARAARMGTLVSMRGTESRVFGVVNALERDQQAGGKDSERTLFEIQVLGEISNLNPQAGFQRGVSSYPPLDASITTVTLRDLALVYARPRASSVHIGRLRHNHKVPAFVLTDSLLGKHFAILGTTGAGKSCAVTIILRSILEEYPNGHVIMIDPHNEYAAAFSDQAELLNPSNLRLPYWLLNFEEIAHILIGGGTDNQSLAQVAILKDAIMRAKAALAGENDSNDYITVDTPVPYRLSDLTAAIKERMGSLNKGDSTSGPYLSLVNRIEGLHNDQRFAFMFQSLAVRDTMRQILGQLLRVPVEGRPITIIDISGLPSEIVDVVVSVLFRLTFELAIWSERGTAPPVLLVCEEAHRYVPEEDTVAFAPTKRVISRIAKEGRKYGVTLALVSQRPSELAVSSLSQCNTIFALRMSNEHDQAFVAKALSENARWLVDGLPSLNTQEAVVVGDGVTVPVHIRFKDLDPEHRPTSGDPSFSSAWQKETAPQFLDRAIERWRRQIR